MDRTTREPFAADLTDEQWAVLEPLQPAAKPGRPPEDDLRKVMNTLLYVYRTRCQWGLVPHDVLPKSTVSEFFAAAERTRKSNPCIKSTGNPLFLRRQL
jgi:putative transposase